MNAIQKSQQSKPPPVQMIDDKKLIVTFAPYWTDKFYCVLLLIIGIFGAYVSMRYFLWPPMENLQCDRSAGVCRDASGYLFGTTEFTMELAKMHESRVIPDLRRKHKDEYKWVVTTDNGTVELGHPTSDEAQIENYRRLAADLQAFLNDPTRKTFSAEYFALGGSRWLLLVIAFGALAWALRWIRGWHAELVFEAVSSTLTIREHPKFFIGPPERVIPLSDVAGVDFSAPYVPVLAGMIFVVQRYGRIVVRGRNRKKLFSYRSTMGTYKATEADQSMVDCALLMRDFLARQANRDPSYDSKDKNR